MKPLLVALRVAGLFALLTTAALRSQTASAGPVTPDASPEARALLQLLSSISGKYTLTGQHNYPNTRSRNTDFATSYLGKTPVIWGTDWGHAKGGDSDSYLARPDIVQEAIRQHRRGAIVTICWHAIPPTSDEPGTFRPLAGADPKKLASVQGHLLDEQFKDLLTPGTPLYDHWCAQVDVIAGYLKQLEANHVPVLWRPYHEMNGDWFWWGGRTTEPYSTRTLYRQLFDRLVHHHHLTNLIWVWSMDRVHGPAMEHAKYFPGLDFVDVLALDVYHQDFAQSYYDSLVALAQGKPLALAEVGNPPSPAILAQQPRWAYYMTWSGMVRNTPRHDYVVLFRDPRVLNLEDSTYADATAAYRQACGLPKLHFVPPRANFTGTWLIDEDRSDFGVSGAAFSPARLDLAQSERNLVVRSTQITEASDDQVTEETLLLDGTESKTQFMNSPRVVTAHLSADGQQLALTSTLIPTWAPGTKFVAQETWHLADAGRHLVIERTSSTPTGPQKSVLVFTKFASAAPSPAVP